MENFEEKIAIILFLFEVNFGTHMSYGHLMLLLDYRNCDENGEPSIVLVDQENDCSITLLAKNFKTFIKGLLTEDEIENYYNRGLLKEKIQDLEGAIEDYTKAIELNCNDIMINPTKVYEFIYVFQTEELIFIEK